jgi:hypothetical protein
MLVLPGALEAGAFDDLDGRRLGVEVTDLEMRWVVEIGDRRITLLGPYAGAEASVRGTATDLLLLVSRLEDAAPRSRLRPCRRRAQHGHRGRLRDQRPRATPRGRPGPDQG